VRNQRQTRRDEDRELPHDYPAERSVLAGIMLENPHLKRAHEIISSADFFSPRNGDLSQNGILFREMLVMGEAQMHIDPITLADHLRSKGILELVGGVSYVESVADGFARIGRDNFEDHAKIVKQKSLLRRLAHLGSELQQHATAESESGVDTLDRFWLTINQLREQHQPRSKVVIYTPTELTAIISDAVDFVAFPFAARGMVALLDGAPKAAGKTTLFLTAISACCRSGLFLNHATKQVEILLVTEENPRTIKAALQRADLCDATNLHILPAMLTGLAWPQLAVQIEQVCAQLKIGWLIVDTFYAIAGLTGDDENKAGAASQALAPLRRIAGSLDTAVSLGRHTRKMGGNIGESGRGSSALTGDADIICELKRLPGSHELQRRKLEFTGRIEPGCFEIELSDGEYRILEESTAVQDETAALTSAVTINPKASARELEKATSIGRNRIPKLLAKAGWTYGEANGWKQVMSQ
jgi:hypothetical protein